jgi:hypothetical protein
MSRPGAARIVSSVDPITFAAKSAHHKRDEFIQRHVMFPPSQIIDAMTCDFVVEIKIRWNENLLPAGFSTKESDHVFGRADDDDTHAQPD